MDNTIIDSNEQEKSNETTFEVAGLNVPIPQHTSGKEAGANLIKLQYTGLDVNDLMDAFNRYKIAPIDEAKEAAELLGYTQGARSSRKELFRKEHLPALAFLYPIPYSPGEVYQFREYVRLRPQAPVEIKEKHKDHSDKCKYLQPNSDKSATHSEPYFLAVEDQWVRVMNAAFPLFITEGECKAIALGLAGYATIGFPGAQMMYADKKAGNHVLHPALNPEGPRRGKTIPIHERDIYLVPDNDFIDNKDVRTAFRTMIRNLQVAGADMNRMKLLILPPSPNRFEKLGVDDFLAHRLGPRWGGDEEKVRQARSLVEGLIEDSRHVNLNEYLLPATSHARGADRFLSKFDSPNKYLAVVQATEHSRHTLWAMYNCDHYMLFPVNQPLNGVTNKVSFKDSLLHNIAQEVWDEGVRIELREGGEEEVGEMNPDYANRVYGLVSPKLPARFNETLIEPFEGVAVDERCVRIKGGLINVNRLFASGMSWDRRAEWLLPPNYRWFGTSQINVCLTNLETPPECPVFLAMVRNMFENDPDKISCLQMAFGKILLAPMFLDHNQFFAFFGVAGSGKSTSTNLLTSLMGEHDVAVLRGNFGGRFDTSELPGKRLILIPENEDGSNHHFTPEMTTTIKKITGRDMIVCERKGQQPTTARIDAEVMIVGNAPPTLEMDEEAFIRRAVFLKAVHKIDHPDHGSSREIMMTKELPGILFWALAGACRIAQGERLTTPPDCEEDLTHAVMSMNLEKRFVMQMVVEKSGKKLPMTDVEEAYRNWLRHNRLPAKEPGWGKLSGAIRDKFGDKYKSTPGKDVVGNNTRVYPGLTLAELMY